MKSLFSILIWLLCFPGYAQSPISHPVEADLHKKIDSIVDLDMGLSGAPGAMVLVTRNGSGLFEKSYGFRNAKTKEPVTSSTLFLTASVTKTITTAALLTVCSKKGISTDTEIGQILTDLPDEIAQLSIHQILSQSSGVLDHWPTRKKWKNDPPGYFAHFGNRLHSKDLEGVFSYTNFGHVLAGMLLSELHGSPFDEAIQEILLAPLEMNQTTYSVEDQTWTNHSAAHRNRKVVPHDYTFPLIRASASMFSTAGDLSKFADCFMNQGVSKGKQVIPIDVIRMMSGKHTPVGVMHNYFGYPGSYYGYGLMSFSFHGVSFVGHPGETTTQNLLFAMAPKSKTSLVIMSNSGLYPFIRTFEVLTDAFLGEYSKPLDTSTVNYDTRTDREVSGTGTDLREQLKEFTGRYFIPSISGGKENSIEVFLKGTALQLELSEEEAYELTWLGDDHFSYVSPQLKFDVEIRFFRDMDGKVRYLNNYWKTAVKVNP